VSIRASDNFNRANADPIGGNWTGINGNGAIVSNQLRQSTAGGLDAYVVWNAEISPADQYCKITFISSGNAGSDIEDGGPCVRLTTGGNGYLFNIQSNDRAGPDSGWELYSLIAGVGTILTSGTIGRALVSGDVMECRIVGNLLSGYLNGVLISSVTNNTYPSGGSYGVHLSTSSQGSATLIFDNFEGGDFVATKVLMGQAFL
jgi:hypothetical protein